MKKKVKMKGILGLALLGIFVLYTISLRCVDIQPIGPQGSYVAYATINNGIHQLFGVNMMLYHVTDWAGVVALVIVLGFGVLGLIQWIQRKHISKVDSSILMLGGFYLFVFAIYLFFECYIINYRPILINGILEVSYPSSTTMLAMCVLPTAMMQFHRLIKCRKVRNAVNGLCGMFTVFMVIGRLVCGVHWFTDILGGSFFSLGMVLLYNAVVNYFEEKTKKNHPIT